MQKHTAVVTHADPPLPDGVHDIYLASEVDARRAALVTVLRELKEGISEHATDTVWYSSIETACDRIDAIIEAVSAN